ncbi:hypothetical protein C8Q70DRAFT_1102066 [Cubamyces menziesii]|nr:hypothetical protein C8Q70DRAFT_1102066 [Cubamyces menziesii]
MFNRVFKRKDESNYSELARRSRVDKQKSAEIVARRPRTAPSSRNPSPPHTDLLVCVRVPSYLKILSAKTRIQSRAQDAVKYRHSMGDTNMSPYYAQPEPFRYARTEASISSGTPIPSPTSSYGWRPREEITQVRTAPGDSPCPRMAPQTPTLSNELRNPFRSNTSDSIASISRTTSLDSFADTGVPVHRMVRASRARIIEDAAHLPQKAIICTTGAQLQVPPPTINAITDPFTDAHVASQPTSPSISRVNSPFSIDQPTTSPTPRHRKWSLLRSPKRGEQSLLNVNIPSGVMSPVRESRLTFWPKA